DDHRHAGDVERLADDFDQVLELHPATFSVPGVAPRNLLGIEVSDPALRERRRETNEMFPARVSSRWRWWPGQTRRIPGQDQHDAAAIATIQPRGFSSDVTDAQRVGARSPSDQIRSFTASKCWALVPNGSSPQHGAVRRLGQRVNAHTVREPPATTSAAARTQAARTPAGPAAACAGHKPSRFHRIANDAAAPRRRP
ncbi:MAG: hypothetical protein LC808_43790, partial [Actinobacteria bacterium]|nr:hypothetical protein [Actinomycetota bacterium]